MKDLKEERENIIAKKISDKQKSSIDFNIIVLPRMNSLIREFITVNLCQGGSEKLKAWLLLSV